MPDLDSGLSRVPKAATVHEVGDYDRSVRGVEITATRTGSGSTATRVAAIVEDDSVSTSVVTGFPMLTRTTIPDDIILAAVVHSAPAGARWCGIDLCGGDVVLFEPGAEHIGVNPPGLSFSFAAINTEAVVAASQGLRESLKIPRSRQVRKLAVSPNVRRLSAAIALQFDASLLQPTRTSRPSEMLSPGLAAALCEDNEPATVSPGAIDDRLVVARCIDLAEELERRPTMAELRRAAFVSERRLRTAFSAVLNVSPRRFFREWGLGKAHGHLLESANSQRTVSDIAMGLGFNHFGRFAHDYARQHGELPSQTLGGVRRIPARSVAR